MNLEDRLAPGNLLGEALALAMPAQVISLFSLPLESVDSSAPTLVTVVPNDPHPSIDPGVTLTSWIGPVGETFTSVATATQESAPIAFDPSLNDELFASTTPTLAQFSPSADTPAPSAGAFGGLSASPMEATFSTSSSSPPASSASPPVVPPPGMNPPSSPPTANNDAYNVSNGTISVPASGVLANDTNPGGQPMSASIVASASHGMAMLNSDGSFSYTATNGYLGADSFTYRVTAGGLTSNVATVSLTVNAPVPTANDDTYLLPSNGSPLVVAAPVGVLANDIGAAGQTLTSVLDTSPSHGTLTLNSDGSFGYTLASGYNGNDSFTYHDTSGGVSTNVATVTLIAPRDPAYSIHHDTVLAIDANSGVLAYYSGTPGAALTVVLAVGPTHGPFSLQNNGSFVYQPTASYVGGDSFSYRIRENGVLTGGTHTATIDVTNSAPVASSASYLVHAGQLLVGGLSGSVYDADTQDTLNFSVNQGPAHGALTLNADGSFQFRAVVGYVGSDSFVYAVNDGAATATATVTIKVADYAPVAVDQSFDLAKGGRLAPDLSRALAQMGAYDQDADNLTAQLVAGPAHAANFILAPDGTFDYTPVPSYEGTDSFTFRVSDGTLWSNTAVVTLNVSSGPIGHEDLYRVPTNGDLTISDGEGVLANDFVPPSASVGAYLADAPSVGTVVLGVGGGFHYVVDTTQPMPDSVTFTYAFYAAAPPPNQPRYLYPVRLLLRALTPPIQVFSETYSGDAVRTITSDFGDPESSTWEPLKNRVPIAFVSGKKMNLVVTFDTSATDKISSKFTAVNSSAGPNLVFDVSTAPAPKVVFDKQINTLVFTWKDVIVPARFARSVDEQWELRPKWYQGPVDAIQATNRSQFTFYSLAAAPPKGLILYHTVVRTGAFATLTTDGSPDAIKKAIMAKFGTLSIQSATLTDQNNLPLILTYWKDWLGQANFLVPDLVSTGDGVCGAWSRFFIAVVQSQGVNPLDTAYRAVFLSKPKLVAQKIVDPKAVPAFLDKTTRVTDPSLNVGFYVKAWTEVGNVPFVNTYTGSSLVAGTALIAGSFKWDIERVKKTLNTLPGQGNLNPRPVFVDHALVLITVKGANGQDTTVLFDPSYGATYNGADDNARLLDFQQKAIAYVGVQTKTADNADRNLIKYKVTFTKIDNNTPRLFGFDEFQ